MVLVQVEADEVGALRRHREGKRLVVFDGGTVNVEQQRTRHVGPGPVQIAHEMERSQVADPQRGVGQYD